MEQGHKEALGCEFPSCLGRITLIGELAGESNLEIPDPAKTDFKDSDAIAQMIYIYIEKGFPEMIQRAETSYHKR